MLTQGQVTVLIGIVGVLLGLATYLGRRSKVWSDRLKEAKEIGEEEAAQKATLARVASELQRHVDQTAAHVERFQEYEKLVYDTARDVQLTTRDVASLSEDVRLLTKSNQDMLAESRESNRLARELLNAFMTGQLTWRPGPGGGRSVAPDAG